MTHHVINKTEPIFKTGKLYCNIEYLFLQRESSNIECSA